jgi:hypothetical protein
MECYERDNKCLGPIRCKEFRDWMSDCFSTRTVLCGFDGFHGGVNCVSPAHIM